MRIPGLSQCNCNTGYSPSARIHLGGIVHLEDLAQRTDGLDAIVDDAQPRNVVPKLVGIHMHPPDELVVPVPASILLTLHGRVEGVVDEVEQREQLVREVALPGAPEALPCKWERMDGVECTV